MGFSPFKDWCDSMRVGRSNQILLCEIGSTAHGLGIEGQDDLDLMGIFVEPPEFVVGLRPAETVVIRDKPEGVRSEPGDTDLVLHPLRKWMKLALNGNPTILALMYAPVIDEHPLGIRIRDEAPDIVLSRRVISAYLGYLTSQKERLLGKRGQKRTKRPELVEAHGYDTKYAAHALRLGWQGLEITETRALAFPMGDPYRKYLLAIRRGEVPQEVVMYDIEKAEARLTEYKDGKPCALPEEPDRAAADAMLIEIYNDWWAGRGVAL